MAAVLLPRLSWATTTDERQCLAHFQGRIVPNMHGLFRSPLWEDVVTRICHFEPAAYHATVALSALHQEAERYGILAPAQRRTNAWYTFSIEQAVRSFSLLTRRQMSQDPYLYQVIALCCLLFVLHGWLQGEYDTAFTHLRSGQRILQNFHAIVRHHGWSWSSCDSSAMGTLATGFAHLDINCAFFGTQGPAYCVEDNLARQPGQLEESATFSTLYEARYALDSLISDSIRFLTWCWSQDQIDPADKAPRAMQLQRLLRRLDRFAQPFQPFYQQSCAQLQEQTQRGADDICLLHHTIADSTRALVLQCDPAVFHVYQPNFRTYWGQADKVRRRIPARPSVTINTGVIPPLFLVSIGCPDPAIRSLASKALSCWPEQEDAFRSYFSSTLSLEYNKLMKILNFKRTQGPPSGCSVARIPIVGIQAKPK
ncbi:uncharacterized protein KD926_009483 [Aspergillus affinis]|uniref:uncharacterized protein n=1 Tax=Aspergillus affinis TaxID=1070780 RepID=UPI0022FEFCC1|nr:uncharacterized protein KD926_009483 [Aspergillus affinis]KAI9039340.1 hypothetical protein KD926_009483 [Aspergillus affinis]